MHDNASNLISIFNKRFPDNQPKLFYSPGRINLIGEHVDYNDGFVMPAAISKGVYYAIAPNSSTQLNFYAADFEEAYSVEVSAIEKQDNWKNYVLGVTNEFKLLGIEVKGFDCVFGGTIPQGSGMSSSAAVEGGLAFALNEFLSAGLDRIQLALLCQRAEHGFPGVKCGIMDQFANMMGKKDHVILLDCQSLNHVYIPLKIDGYKIVLLNTKIHHSLAGSEYNVRRQQCKTGLDILGRDTSVKSFRDINSTELLLNYKDKMGEKVYNRCLFVVEEIARTQRASELLHQNELEAFGQLLFTAHAGLRDLYEVSCPELDFLVEIAKKSAGVIGARMMGGGFGGCTINIVKDADVETFINEAAAAYKEHYHIILEATIVETADGVAELQG